ncbi:MAG: cysteine dioxygenase family protein [Candidatus Tectomicrobia bacterium]|jgi:3-mercaptopropionate dioxygenase|nr:cysteine dioxygenase family protein [Candidatus Tectomicrobia bacterium]
MLTRGYSLDEFVHDMEALLETGAEQGHIFAQGAAWLERLIQNPECIPPEYRVPVGKGPRPNHGSYVLHRSPNGLLVTAVVWGPGDHTGPHDHHTWGMIGVMNNTLQETRFRRLDDGSRPDYAQLEKDRVSFFKPGEVSLLIPGVDEIHQMDNPSDRPTVEIHVYGKDLAGLQRCRFNAETGSVRPFMTEKYDNE